MFLIDERGFSSNSSFFPFTETSKILSDNIITYKLKEMDCLIFDRYVRNPLILTQINFGKTGLDFAQGPFELSHSQELKLAFMLQTFGSKTVFDILKLAMDSWILLDWVFGTIKEALKKELWHANESSG